MTVSLRSRLSAVVLASSFALAACSPKTPATPAPQTESFPLNGVSFPAQVHSNHAPNARRDITVDCSPLIEARNREGKKVLALTVAFISNFDATNSPEYMAQLDPVNRQIIEGSRKNYTVNPVQVQFMTEHVNIAHGVSLDDVKSAYKRCDSQWKRSL